MVIAFLNHKLRLFFYLCLLTLAPITSFADAQLKIDALNISIDEVFKISIISDSAYSGSVDISALSQDFEILDKSKQTSMNIINGHITQSSSWIYTVVAKHTGKILIPAITVGNESTQATEINVKEPSSQNNSAQDIILEADIEQPATYVQGQFIYVQRLLSAKPYRSDATLTRPRLTAGRADIEALGNTPERIVQRNGRDYRMLTRRFAIIPQESGKLVLAPSVFSGTLRRESQRNMNTFSYSSRSKRVRVKSKEIILNIKPRPAEFTGKDWIVAKDFSLHLSWPIPLDELKAGEPITISLAAIADGLRAEQLPDIKLQAPNGIKLYPEKPIFDNIKNLDGIVGTMNKNIVLVATGGGEFILPKLSIPWWNSRTEKQEIATLEAVKLSISGAPATKPAQKALATPEEVNKQRDNDEQQVSSLSNTLIILISLVGLLLFLISAWLYKNWREKTLYSGITKKETKKQVAVNQQKILQNLQQACTNNKAQDANIFLQQWLQSIGKTNLDNSYLQQAINELNHKLYGQENTLWQGKNLWQAVDKYQNKYIQQLENTKDKKQEELEPLYL